MDRYQRKTLIRVKQDLRAIAGEVCDHISHDTREEQRCPGFELHRAISRTASALEKLHLLQRGT